MAPSAVIPGRAMQWADRSVVDVQGEGYGGTGAETYSSPKDLKDWWGLPLRKHPGTSQLLNLEGLFLVAALHGPGTREDGKQGQENTECQIPMQELREREK